jgi:hypothetical protein
MRRVPLLAMLLVLASVLLVPARAAAPVEGIFLRGSRTAYVDLYVYVNRTISIDDVVMTTKGTYVGFYLSPAPADRDTVGALVMPRVGATGTDAVMQLGQSWDVRAGRYRMFLLTDGPAEVFVPIEGQGYRGWVPRGRAPLSVRRTDFDVDPGSTGGAARTPVSLRARSLVVVAGLVTSPSLTAVDHLSACVTNGSTSSCGLSYRVDTRVPLAQTWSYGAALVGPGSHIGVLELNRAAGVDAGSHVAGTLMVLTIGRQT